MLKFYCLTVACMILSFGLSAQNNTTAETIEQTRAAVASAQQTHEKHAKAAKQTVSESNEIIDNAKDRAKKAKEAAKTLKASIREQESELHVQKQSLKVQKKSMKMDGTVSALEKQELSALQRDINQRTKKIKNDKAMLKEAQKAHKAMEKMAK